MPNQEEIRRRLKGALELAGVTALELGRRTHEADSQLGGRDPERIMQGLKEMGESHINAYSQALNVPRDWFTVEDFHEWVRLLEDPDNPFRGKRREELVEEFRVQHLKVLTRLSEVIEGQGDLRQRLEHLEGGQAGAGNA